jgi:hypothetical protein
MSGRRKPSGRVWASLIAITAAVFAGSAPSANGSTVTVGSPLTSFDSSFSNNGATATLANTSLNEPGAHVTSPVNGTIVSWRVTTLDPGTFALRVLRPDGSGQYTGAGSSPQLISETGPHTFTASLPIQVGDLVGVDIPDSHGAAAIAIANSGPGSNWGFRAPAIPDGSTLPFNGDFSDSEVAISADVQTPDPTTPAKKKCKKKKHKRSASVAKKKCKKKKKK